MRSPVGASACDIRSPAAQVRLGTGILTIRSAGEADMTRRPSRVPGVVRVQLQYVDCASAQTVTLDRSAESRTTDGGA